MYGTVATDLQSDICIYLTGNFRTLLKQGPYGGMPVVRRAVIVAPSSLTGNWTRELTRWLGGQRLCVYTVDSKHKLSEYQPAMQPILIISYDMFSRCSQQVLFVEYFKENYC